MTILEQLSRSWNRTSSEPLTLHSCNCIGCCKICGMCSTHPKHTPENCQKMANYRSMIKEIYSD